jgi:hypothetical protein
MDTCYEDCIIKRWRWRAVSIQILVPREELGGGAELGGRCFDIALPVLVGEHRAATLTQLGAAGEYPVKISMVNSTQSRD